MDRKQPERLTNEQYMTPSFPLRIFHSELVGHLEVHWHEFYEMHLILSGRGTHILNGISYELRRGSIFLLTPADFHEINTPEDDPIMLYNLIFSDDLLREPLRQMLFRDTKLLAGDVPETEMAAIEAEFQMIIREVTRVRPGQQIMIEGAFERILISLSRICLDSTLPSGLEEIGKHIDYKHPAIGKALIYMQHHFREPLKLEEAARQAKLAPNYFSESFSKTVGISFQSYLQELRLRFAKSLLNVSNLSVTEICYASGFNTLSHFERAFKHKFSESPRSYRQKKGGKPAI